MRNIILLSVMLICVIAGHAQTNRPSIAVMDIMSSTLSSAERATMSDLLATEMFRVRSFRLVERSVLRRILEEHRISMSGLTSDSAMLEAGRLLAAQYLFVCTAEAFSGTMVMNVRIIDVNTTAIDYTENIVLPDGRLTMDALKDMVKKIELHYLVRLEDSVGDKSSEEALRKRWASLGASMEEVTKLVSMRRDPATYLELRQYDLGFRISNYVEACSRNWEPEVVKGFLQAGIPYSRARRALGNGITGVNTYKTVFMPKGLSFDEYLDAYEHRILLPDQYEEFKRGYRTDRLILGLGGVADSLPIANAQFKFYIWDIGWEHFMTTYQRGMFKWSTEIGLNNMNFFVPVPYAQCNLYLGGFPYYAKLAVGGHAELFLGGHAAVYARLGMEFFEFIEYNVMVVLWGNQPRNSYADFSKKQGDPGYLGLQYPYIGVFGSIKF